MQQGTVKKMIYLFSFNPIAERQSEDAKPK
jgi:hypothetical protein